MHVGIDNSPVVREYISLVPDITTGYNAKGDVSGERLP